MIKGLESASHSLNINDKKIGSLANNLANLNSTGYKREIPFEQLIVNNGEGMKTRRMIDFSQGVLEQTNNPLDLAIQGDAFFVVENPEGEILFTKNGKFELSEDGFVTDQSGNMLQGEGGPIQLQEDFWNQNQSVSINSNGEIHVGDNYIDKVKLVKVEDKTSLTRYNGSTFKINEGYFENVEKGEVEVVQGYLESSNINPIIEMEEMIRISKNYESAHKMIQYIDEVMGKANEIGNVK